MHSCLESKFVTTNVCRLYEKLIEFSLHRLFSLQILVLYDALDTIDTTKVVSYVKSLQQEDGSFFGDMWGMSIHGSLHWQDKQKINEQHRDATSRAVKCCQNAVK